MSTRDVDDGQAEPAALEPSGGAAKKPPTAERAQAEAAARRTARDRAVAARPQEVGGPKGPDPVRYGDSERNGIASGFQGIWLRAL
jgi:hypothetical protein